MSVLQAIENNSAVQQDTTIKQAPAPTTKPPRLSMTPDEWTDLDRRAGRHIDLGVEIAQFDLVGYITDKYPGKVSRVGGEVRLDPCPFCKKPGRFGIDDRSSPQAWVCPGDTCGRIGGNIINFLMAEHNTDENGARRIFKYELLGISEQAEKELYAIDKAAEEAERRKKKAEAEPEVDPLQYAYSMADVEAETKEYIKYPIVPKDEITSITGMMDTGKTFCLLKMMLDIANGVEWHTERNDPNYTPFTVAHGKVLGFFAEDSHKTSIKQRLKLMVKSNEEMRNVIVADTSDRCINWRIGGKAMEALIAYYKPLAVFIDTATRFAPYTVMHGQPFNENSKQHVSAVMDILENYARKYNTAIIITNHPNKQSGQSASHRTSGSQEWLNGVRSGWLLARNPDDEMSNVLCCIKANDIWQREHRKSIILPFDYATGVSIGGDTDIKADDIRERKLSDKKESEPGERKQTAKTKAKIWLFEYLDSKGGAALAEDVLDDGEKNGIKKYLLREVVRESRGAIMSTGAGANQKAYWYTEDGERKVPPEQIKIGDMAEESKPRRKKTASA